MNVLKTIFELQIYISGKKKEPNQKHVANTRIDREHSANSYSSFCFISNIFKTKVHNNSTALYKFVVIVEK